MDIDQILKSLSRCRRTKELQVVPKDIMGPEDIDNALVLCQPCVEFLGYSEQDSEISFEFDERTCDDALMRAGYRCECTGCPACDSILDNAIESATENQG